MEVKIGMVVSQFNYEITGEMRKRAEQRAKEVGAVIVKIVEVPGSYEIPLAVKLMLKEKEIEGVVALGTIIKGGTDHDLVIGHAISQKLMELSLHYEKPVSLGISGPNSTWQQSEKRIEEYAIRSVDSVVSFLRNSK
ncbi:MAG TPA: 6,7-dimethyl-8-ribityllumazine synthase [Candidatus Nanoarchaeia archaeon]|nr:6,7-dimethyl-8-ribityllumazine synthase [Candidatus Nanoarchaeia archaeon]